MVEMLVPDRTSTPPSRWSAGPLIAGLLTLASLAGCVWLLLPSGEGTSSRAIETVTSVSSSAAVAAESPAPATIAAPTSTPLPLVSTPLPLITIPVVVPSPTAAPTAIPATATPTPETAATPTPATATPEPTAIPTATESNAGETTEADTETESAASPQPTVESETTTSPEATTATAEPEATTEPTATEPTTTEPTATAEPAPVQDSETLVAVDAQETVVAAATSNADLPEWSAGSTFNYVLYAGPSIGIAAIHDRPNGQELQVTFESATGGLELNDLQNPTYAGNQLVLQVLRGEPGDEWAQVSLPTRPNGQTGWVQTDGWEWGSSNFMVRVNVTTNSVQVWNGSELVMETGAVTGKPSSRTPMATGFVDEKIYGLGAAYGPVALSFSFFSDDLGSFAGGAPKIALHGTNRNDLIGQNQSNGCIRVDNDDIRRISELVPVGSRVEIVA